MFNFFRIAVYEGSVQRPLKQWRAEIATSFRVEEGITLTTRSNENARARAEASFRKEERAKEGAMAMMEYEAHGRLVREKTERLKALRLAKAAADKKHAI